MSSGLSALNAALQTGVVGFEKYGHIPGRKGLMKDSNKLHYGNCRIQYFLSLTNAMY